MKTKSHLNYFVSTMALATVTTVVLSLAMVCLFHATVFFLSATGAPAVALDAERNAFLLTILPVFVLVTFILLLSRRCAKYQIDRETPDDSGVVHVVITIIAIGASVAGTLFLGKDLVSALASSADLSTLDADNFIFLAALPLTLHYPLVQASRSLLGKYKPNGEYEAGRSSTEQKL